jgi:hypothetical protein
MVTQDYKYQTIEGVVNKRCSRCRVFKPITFEYYTKGQDSKYGIKSHCLECNDKPKFNFPNFNEKGLLFCRKCEIYKTEKEFHAQKENKHRNGKTSHCKQCNNDYKTNFRKSTKGENLEKHLSKILSTCKLRSKKLKLSSFEFELDVNFLKQLFETQNKKCKLSGLEMTYIINNGKSIYNISVDRIKSNKGYTKDNVQLVCNQINTMKNSLEDEDFLFFCKTIVNNYER